MLSWLTKPTAKPRSGFTLIEMLVVITIILIILGLGVFVIARSQDGSGVKQSADRLQGLLLSTKQRAVRDKRITGIRLTPDGNVWVGQVVVVQQPDDAGSNATGTIVLNGSTCTFSNYDPTSTLQKGDYLELNGGGLLHRINTVSSGSITLDSTVSGAASYNYRIIRQPEPLPGLQPLQLQTGIAIDLNNNASAILNLTANTATQFNYTTTGYVDILFTPSGNVFCKGAVGDRLVLWVRDTTISDPKQGGTMLIVINVRTGLIAAVPVDLTSGDPYSQAKDPQISGM